MAAVSIPPSPQVLSNMTNRRVPLANVPNAANSPYRAVAAAATKRQRAYAIDQRDLGYEQPPPAKKQIIEVEDVDSRRLAPRRGSQAQPNALQKKLEAARDSRSRQRSVDLIKGDLREDIKLWREHYRRAFPSYVLYFDAVPDDVRNKIVRDIRALGSREEKFFSKAVTHVITSRPIPKDNDPTTPTDVRGSVGDPRDAATASKTINPSLLDRSCGSQSQQHVKTNFTFEAALQKKSQLNNQSQPNEVDPRRQQTSNGDILVKAKEMRMKLWTVDKLQRMLNTLFDEAKDEALFGPSRATRTAAMPYRRNGRDVDLSQLLQKEKMTGPTDRDMTVATQEMIPLRGCYVYVYDMDEKTKPVMIREYAIPSKKEDGKWPQLRSTSNGKCPFIEDPSYTKKLQQQEQENAQPVAEPQEAGSRTRATAATQSATRTRAVGEERQILAEDNAFTRNAGNMVKTEESNGIPKPLDPPKLIPAKRRKQDGMPPMFNTAQANIGVITRYAGGEPVASGVQPSNITSAIRSQVVSSFSSTAAVPGARAATSKEVHQLKRKVLEKTSGPSANSMPSSHLNDVRAAINQDRGPPPRAAKRKAQESLAGITEEMTVSEQEAAEKRLAIIRRKETVEKDPKPGYCENCRDKFNDFDEHIMSRKHRKFAISSSNWKELDDLLAQLERPLAPGYRPSDRA